MFFHVMEHFRMFQINDIKRNKIILHLQSISLQSLPGINGQKPTGLRTASNHNHENSDQTELGSRTNGNLKISDELWIEWFVASWSIQYKPLNKNFNSVIVFHKL